MTPSRTVLCVTLAVLAATAAADQTPVRELLKMDMYSAALAPLPGSDAGGSGNCSAIWNPFKDKLEVRVYLFGQTQTTGVSLNQGSPNGASIVTLYSGPAVSPNGLFDGLTNNGTVVAADLKGPLAGKAAYDLHKVILRNSTDSLGIFCVTSTSNCSAALSGPFSSQLAKAAKNSTSPPSSTPAAGH